MKKLFYGLILFFLLTSSAGAWTYYVKPTGNDDSTGLSDQAAWQHVWKGCQEAVAGDTVFIYAPATYTDTCPDRCDGKKTVLTPYNSGSEGNEIVFKGWGGIPILKGDTTYGADTYTYGCCVDGGIHHIIFDSLEVRHSYRGFVFGQASYITYRYCVADSTTSDNNNGGFCSKFWEGGGLHHITVEYSKAFHIRESHAGSPANYSGIHVYRCDSCFFYGNVLFDLYRGIHIKGAGADTFGLDTMNWIYCYDNLIYDIEVDGICTNTQGTLRRAWFHHNTIYDCGGTGLNSDGYPYARADSVFMYNNTVDGGGVGGGYKESYIRNVGRTFVFNNIFYDCKTPYADHRASITHECYQGAPPYFDSDNNCFYNPEDSASFYRCSTDSVWTLPTWQSHTGWDLNSTEENPMFVDTATHDYHLQSGSPCATGGVGGVYPTYRGAYAPSTGGKKLMIKK